MAGKPFPYNVPVNGRFGAPTGRPSVGNPHEDYVRLTLRKVPLHEGVYDPGGAYWGSPSDLWCAWSADREIVQYVRTKGYLAAEQVIHNQWPQADFLKG